ncbi:unnamed protein product [Eretmochelys imbricata]
MLHQGTELERVPAGHVLLINGVISWEEPQQSRMQRLPTARGLEEQGCAPTPISRGPWAGDRCFFELPIVHRRPKGSWEVRQAGSCLDCSAWSVLAKGSWFEEWHFPIRPPKHRT